MGLGVIIDTVNPLHLTRKLFRELAKESNANLLQFELKTNSLLLHKKRIEQRKIDIVGHNLPTWDKVLNAEYEEWDENVDGLVTVIFTDNGKTAKSIRWIPQAQALWKCCITCCFMELWVTLFAGRGKAVL